jgi:hypothetical protein
MSLESNLSKLVPSPILVHSFDPGVEEAFFTLARDIKKRLIDTAGKDDGKNAGNVNVNQKQNAAQGSCCNFDSFQVVNSFVEVIKSPLHAILCGSMVAATSSREYHYKKTITMKALFLRCLFRFFFTSQNLTILFYIHWEQQSR